MHIAGTTSQEAYFVLLFAAQMLSSVSTLLHDTYLPLYMSEVLHMSNTKVYLMVLQVRIAGMAAAYE